MKREMLIIAGVLILLSGCSLAPKYTRPAPPIPAQWPQGKAYKNIPAQPDAVIIPELYRQGFFADESLQKIMMTPQYADHEVELRGIVSRLRNVCLG